MRKKTKRVPGYLGEHWMGFCTFLLTAMDLKQAFPALWEKYRMRFEPNDYNATIGRPVLEAFARQIWREIAFGQSSSTKPPKTLIIKGLPQAQDNKPSLIEISRKSRKRKK